MTVLKELAVVLRTYKDRDGNDKKVWLNVGTLNETPKGQYIALDRHINFAAIPVTREGDNRVYVMLFEPKAKKGEPASHVPPAVKQAASGHFDDFADDIPF